MSVKALIRVVLLLSISSLDALLLRPHSETRGVNSWHRLHETSSQKEPATSKVQMKLEESGTIEKPFSHQEITWKLRPPQETKRWRKYLILLAARFILLQCKWKGVDPPFCLCPKGGKATLEAYLTQDPSSMIAKFGITTIRGPPADPINQSVEELYDMDLQGRFVASAAIIFMHVQPNYRRRNLGALALELISALHATQGADVTLLVADDNGSGKLVEWYERHGFRRAPLLQDLLGSPGGKYGITMIAPTNANLSRDCKLQWW
jgi:ribosomal protein S18 acetylase RimI-like enzyme